MRIEITKDLRDYLERLNYEAIRYCDLLQSAKREDCDASEKEWEMSEKFFRARCEEAQQAKQAMLESLREMYPELEGTNWRIDFRACCLTDEPASESVTDTVAETYNDFLRRMYPELISGGEMRINGDHCRDITIQVTEDCNLRCSYCYQHHKTKNQMSFQTAKEFIDLILDSDERSNSYITSTQSIGAIIDFIGGEPWLEVELIDKVSRYFIAECFRRRHPWATRFMFSICSNGVLHFDENVQDYIRRNRQHMSYSVTVDGDKELHDSCRVDEAGNGSYDRAMAAVRDYYGNGGRIGSKMTIAPANVQYVARAVENLVDEGYRQINLNCVYEEGWTNEHAAELYRQLKVLADWLKENDHLEDVRLSIFDERHCKPKHPDDDKNWCGGCGLMLAVNHTGSIYPCLRYMESSVGDAREPYIIGTVEDGINVLDEHRARVAEMAKVTCSSQSSEECIKCPIAAGCGWCSAYNYEITGSVNRRVTYICCMHKARSLATYYYQKLRGTDAALYCPREWAEPIIGKEEYDRLEAM